MGSKTLARQKCGCLPIPCLRAREQNFLRHRYPPPLLSHLHLWPDGQRRRAHNSSRDPRPDPIPSTHVGVCVRHSQRVRTPRSVQLHLPLSSLVCGNPDPHPSYSCYKRTHVCHFTKKCRALWTGHLPRTSAIRLELQKPCFCVSFWKHTYDIKRDVSAQRRERRTQRTQESGEISLKETVSMAPPSTHFDHSVSMSAGLEQNCVRLLLSFLIAPCPSQMPSLGGLRGFSW